ncbi:MAG: MFS transporter [Acidobacteria bacterium]|nr:MFS transporter [Acidobacteriota bacterium]
MANTGTPYGVATATTDAVAAERKTNARNALIAGFLGWTLDAFDFFVLTFVLTEVATAFQVTRPQIALTLTASLAMRPVGALIFGSMADRYGRRLPLMMVIIFYSLVQVLSGFAPNYTTFFVLRLLYGIGMGGEWGVGASLVMESVSPKWRGVVSGLLQEGYALGYLLAAIAYYAVFPHWGWRALFFLGGLPALLALFIRAKVQEPEAWKETRSANWAVYRRSILKHWKLFGYLVMLMSMMSFIAHGTQDMYPTFLEQARHFTPNMRATTTIISMIGAIFGGLTFGLYSDRIGRRRAMIIAVVLGVLLVPIWIFAPSTGLIMAGAFAMQFVVQGAWGVIPAHINELSPNELRGFFPGFAYQIGVLISSTIVYIEAVLGETMGYAAAMGILAIAVLIVGAVVIALGPEAKGVAFGRSARPS